jgi:PTH1 family peptidyl-tRNA hydrolase
VADFVLHRPRREEQGLIEEAIDKALRIIPMVCEGKMNQATMQLHTD